MKLHKLTAALLIAATLSTSVPASLETPYTVTVEAHSGRTDSYGGHHDYNNVSGLGSYHYHHGYGAHLHPNGICPYGTSSTDAAALLAQQQQAELLAQQQQAALLAQQQQAALLAQQQQAELLAQQQQAALLAQQQQQAALLAQQQQAEILAQQQQAQLLAQQQIMSMVMQTQAALKQFGFYNGEVNGVWDSATQQALVLFQTAYGLTVDGTINDQIITLFNIH